MFAPRRALAALLVAASPPALALSEAPPAPPPSHPDQLRDLLQNARRLSAHPVAVKPPFASIESPADLHAARQLLDRYYALSTDAIQQAALAEPRAVTQPHANKSKLAPKRTPADKVFRPLPPHTFSAPACVKYLIVGGGTAAWSAIDAILQHDPLAVNQVLLISHEPLLPYNRTMLSKELFESDQLQSPVSPSHVQYAYKHFKPEMENAKVSVTNETAVLLDPDDKFVQLSSGHRVTYNKLLLATGGAPRAAASVTPALGAPDIKQHVSTFRTLEDYHSLRDKLQHPDQSVVVVGGGFLGVNVVQSAVITDATPSADQQCNLTLHVDATEPTQLDANHVVVAVGIDPSTHLAKTGGLELIPATLGSALTIS
ncbi:Pyridine nucleotide-disulfide oxidoreductase [Gracilaria domingensis]|nr:Pyridine nucleotide-disulfide oxidoreductase [Gracilaria domingensis]